MTYQPPQSQPSLAYHSANIPNYLPLHDRGRNARVLLWIMAALGPAGIFLELYGLSIAKRTLGGHELTQEEAVKILAVIGSIGCISVIAFTTCVVFFCMWSYRANRNLRALGMNLDTSPGWTVGWWFIPIANLFKPYLAIRELYLASAPDAAGNFAWRTRPVPLIFGLWWTTWLVGNFCDRISWALGKNEEDYDALFASSMVGIVGSVISIVAALLIAKIVGDITARIEARSLHQPVPTPSAYTNTPY